MATTLTFPEWLAQQRDRGDDVAEFATQAAALTDFPDSGGKAIYDGYFETALPVSRTPTHAPGTSSTRRRAPPAATTPSGRRA